jgi:hypothetical protein
MPLGWPVVASIVTAPNTPELMVSILTTLSYSEITVNILLISGSVL